MSVGSSGSTSVVIALITCSREGKDPATIDNLAKQAPLDRIGSPEDIAEVISFLAGPARWVNGQVVRANGGII